MHIVENFCTYMCIIISTHYKRFTSGQNDKNPWLTHLAEAVSLAGNWFLRVAPLPTVIVSVCSPNTRHTTR